MGLGAVFFDIDDTLYSSTQFADSARRQAVQAMLDHGLRADRERVMEELREVVAEFGSNDDRHYNRLLERLPSAATSEVNPALLVMAGVIAYHEAKWRELRVRPDAEELLAALHRGGVKVGIISAGLTMKQMEKILRLGLVRWIHRGLIFITDQQGIAKSNPKLYSRAAAAAGVEPGAAMHVGDHPLNDVESARRAGMIAVLHEGSGKYQPLAARCRPDHRIRKLSELLPILVENYGFPA